MFSTTGLFKGIPCPEGEKCTILQCIFSHELRPKAADVEATKVPTNAVAPEPENRKRKLSDSLGQTRLKAPAASALQSPALKSPSQSALSSAPTIGASSKPIQQKFPTNTPRTLQKVVTPPPLQDSSRTSAATTKTLASVKPPVKESLNPRKIPHDPAGHAKRTVFLKYIHAVSYTHLTLPTKRIV